jgi:hypothetical protein
MVKILLPQNGGGGGGGGGGAADSITFSTNYRRDTAIANVRAEMFLNSVIVAGEGSYYHSAGADFSVPNGNKDAQVYIQQAADLAVTRGVSTVFMDGLFTVNDSIIIKPTYNLTFLGGGRANTIIYTDSTIWSPSVPLFGFSIAGSTLNNITFRDFSVHQPDNGNNTTAGDNGLWKHTDSGRIENITYDNLFVRGSGDFGSIINHTYFSETAGTFGSIGTMKIIDCDLGIDATNRSKQYVFHCKLQADKIEVDRCKFKMLGTAGGSNNNNAAAFYGMNQSLSVTNSEFISQVKSHSPLAASMTKNVRIHNNYVYLFEPNTGEGLLEVESKLTHVVTSLVDTVQNFSITGNVIEAGNWGRTHLTNYGIIVTDRDGTESGGLANFWVQHGSITGNIIKNVEVGIFAEYSNNVVISGNTMVDVATRLYYGRTDLGDSQLGVTEYNGIRVDGANETLKMYDNGSREWTEFIKNGALKDEYVFGDSSIITLPTSKQVLIGAAVRDVDLFVSKIQSYTTNLSIGQDAGDPSIGLNNISLGYLTGQFLTAGQDNVLIGSAAGKVNAANYNVLIGASSGQKVTTGGQNVFIGRQSGLQTVTGASNVMIGGNAGENNSLSNNVYIGRDAAKDVSAQENVFVGRTAGRYHAGNFNLLIGAFASEGNLSSSKGNYNTFLGYKSGLNTDGGTNTMVGARTGSQSINVALNGNVLIGYQVGQSNTQDNRLMIDNTNTETPLIDGDFANDIVTINSIFPTDGMYIYVSNTNATFTTIGFWAYENGSWVDK